MEVGGSCKVACSVLARVDALVRSGLSGPGEGEWVSTKPWAPDWIEMKYLTPPGLDPRGSDMQHSGADPAPEDLGGWSGRNS